MIGVLTHHWAKSDKVSEAQKLLDRNGEAQSKAPGFVSRQTLVSRAPRLGAARPVKTVPGRWKVGAVAPEMTGMW